MGGHILVGQVAIRLVPMGLGNTGFQVCVTGAETKPPSPIATDQRPSVVGYVQMSLSHGVDGPAAPSTPRTQGTEPR